MKLIRLVFHGLSSLAYGLVQENGSGGRSVEGRDLTLHGDADLKVTAFCNDAAHAYAFVTDDDGGGAGEIGLVQGTCALCGGTVDPDTTFFQLADGGREIGDSGNGHVLDSAGRGFADNGGETYATALGNDDTMGAGTFRTTEDGT